MRGVFSLLLSLSAMAACALEPFPIWSAPRRLTDGPHDHLLASYFAIDSWSPDLRYLLVLETDVNGRLPEANERCTLGLVDTADSNRFIPVTTTACWNFQEAAMAFWMNNDEILFNDVREGKFRTVIMNWRTKAERVLPMPVSAVSEDRTWAVSLNYARLSLTRPDYGYAGDGQDSREGVEWPEDDGLWTMDLKTGETKLILSVAAGRSLMPPTKSVPGKPGHPLAYYCHTVISKDGAKIFFLARSVDWFDKSIHKASIWETTSFTVNRDGTDLRRCFKDYWAGSHFNWAPDGSHRMIVTVKYGADETREHWASAKSPPWAPVEFTVGEEEKVRLIGNGHANLDWHCVYSPDGKFMSGETYWKIASDGQPYRPWVLVRLEDGAVKHIGDFLVPEKYRGGYWRCDLHSRYRRDGRQIAFNSVHEGSRQVYVMDITEAATTAAAPVWPPVTREMKPWCYNWWMGSAVDERGLAAQADALAKAGFGGFHVIPIYGAKGYEGKYRTFLSDDWMRVFAAAVRIGGERDLGVDLTMGSGWCFGGPQLKPEQGCRRLFATADEKAIKKGMEVVWKGKDAEGKMRYLVSAFTGQQVKRAGPGGQGPMMDPFSTTAMEDFLKPYTAAFDRPGAVKPEHLYHDSYEYFRAAWTPELIAAFRRKRGYDLKAHLAELAGVGDAEAVARVKCDYRETLSDLIIEDVFPKWFNWCRARGIATRNEAHGAPANWLDFYALSDIPETEMFGEECRDVLVSKFASSAAHLTGKPMVSSESCTWLGQHFTETLSDAKKFLDRLFLAGVNHMFYHGTCYSDVDAPWPGWCFYAACQMNPRNPIWRDTDALSAYITRCQSVFRAYRPDHDVLLYWPLRDYWMNAEGYELQMSVHNAPQWFGSQPVGTTAAKLYDAGYAFDYVSDRLLATIDPKRTQYRAVVVPPCRHMSERTKARLAELAAAGLKVYYEGALPEVTRREPFNAAGLMYARYRKDGETMYFLVNQSREHAMAATRPVKSKLRPAAKCASAWTMDPLTGKITQLPVVDGEVEISLDGGHSTLLCVSEFPAAGAEPPPAATAAADARFEVAGPWHLEPVAGGPDPWPQPRTMAELSNWAVNEDGSENPFSGTMRYRVRFDAPHVGARRLSLGDVRQSARAMLNGVDLGKAIMAPYEFAVPPGALKARDNVLEVEVTSVAANRVRWMDQRQIPWRVFHDINFAAYSEGKWKGKGPFNAAKWPLTVNGLLGPVVFAGK